MATRTELHIMLNDFSRVMGKVNIRIEQNYSKDMVKVIIIDEITNVNHSFSYDNRTLASKETSYLVENQLRRIEEEMYKRRGKHLTESYDFYDKPSKFGTKEFKGSGYTYKVIDDTSINSISELERMIQEDEIKQMADALSRDKVNKTKIAERQMKEALAAKQAQERKDLLEKNEDFGSF